MNHGFMILMGWQADISCLNSCSNEWYSGFPFLASDISAHSGSEVDRYKDFLKSYRGCWEHSTWMTWYWKPGSWILLNICLRLRRILKNLRRAGYLSKSVYWLIEEAITAIQRLCLYEKQQLEGSPGFIHELEKHERIIWRRKLDLQS